MLTFYMLKKLFKREPSVDDVVKAYSKVGFTVGQNPDESAYDLFYVSDDIGLVALVEGYRSGLVYVEINSVLPENKRNEAERVAKAAGVQTDCMTEIMYVMSSWADRIRAEGYQIDFCETHQLWENIKYRDAWGKGIYFRELGQVYLGQTAGLFLEHFPI